MPLFQAIVTETVATRRWYTVEAEDRDEAQELLAVGDTLDEQDIVNSAEVLCRVVDTSTLELVPSQPDTTA